MNSNQEHTQHVNILKMMYTKPMIFKTYNRINVSETIYPQSLCLSGIETRSKDNIILRNEKKTL